MDRSSSKWGKNEIMTLLDRYKDHKILYDFKHPEYYNRLQRGQILKLISGKLDQIRPNTNVNDIKTKIKTLRSQYSNEKAMIAKSRKNGQSYVPKLWCYYSLEFLDDYVRERPAKIGQNMGKNIKSTVVGDESFELDDLSRTYDILEGEKEKIKSEPDEFIPESENSSIQTTIESTDHESKEDIFAKFVSSELKQIKDINIYNETKWKIQLAIMEGIKAQTKSKTFHHQISKIYDNSQ